MQPNSFQKKTKSLNSYVYYSNMAIEMGVIIALGVFGGVKLDKWLDKSPLFTLICSIFAVFIAMYTMIKGVTQQSKNKKDESKDTH